MTVLSQNCAYAWFIKCPGSFLQFSGFGTGTGLTVTCHLGVTPEAIGGPEANLVICFLEPGKICRSRTTIHPGNQWG